MRLTLGFIVRGALAGLGMSATIAIFDVLSHGEYRFGLQTGIIGVTAGGLALGLALLMALVSYYLASRNRAPSWRKRLLIAAIWAGAAGMACGFGSTALWLAARRPWFP